MNKFRRKKILHIFGLVLICFIAVFLYTELLVSITGQDIKIMYSLFHTVSSNDALHGTDYVELYRDSKDTELLYELVPGALAVYDNCRHPLDPVKSPAEFYINSFGMRDVPGKTRHKAKKKGVFRIIVLGGSNTLGVTVSSKETYPAMLEAELEKISPGKFEVLNAGLAAFVMSQKSIYGRKLLKEFDPDLFIIQSFNMGRRAFFYDADLEYFFKHNKELFLENVPLILTDNYSLRKIHEFFVLHSKAYRFFISLINYSYVYFNKLNVHDPHKAFYYRADEISQREYDIFVKEVTASGKKILLLNARGSIDYRNPPAIYMNVIEDPALPEEYREIHPPSYVYKLYVKRIIEELRKLNII